MTDFDSEIDSLHRAAQAAEDRAVAVMQRMKAIPGLTTLVDKMPRRFGEPPNPYAAGNRSLTVTGVLEKSDPALAQYLAQQAGTSINAPDYRAKAEAEAKAAEVERMRQATERAALAGVHMHNNRRFGT